ncbi:MAG: DNA-directed RNA polymerase subunit alpha C-terminal domain-containing protein, partial [Coriobacteriales bacterium]
MQPDLTNNTALGFQDSLGSPVERERLAWIIPCDPHECRVFELFQRSPQVMMPRPACRICDGDLALIYVSEPIRSICFLCEVASVGINPQIFEEPGCIMAASAADPLTPSITLQLHKTVFPGQVTLEHLHRAGLAGDVSRPIEATSEVLELLGITGFGSGPTVLTSPAPEPHPPASSPGLFENRAEYASVRLESLCLTHRPLTALRQRGVQTLHDLITFVNENGLGKLPNPAEIFEKTEAAIDAQDSLESLARKRMARRMGDVDAAVPPLPEAVTAKSAGSVVMPDCVLRSLRKKGVSTVGELLRMRRSELLRISGIGESRFWSLVDEVVALLQLREDYFRTSPDKVKLGEKFSFPASKLNRPVNTLGFSSRAESAFARAGIRTLGDVLEKTEEQLLNMSNFGYGTLGDLKGRLEALYRGEVLPEEEERPTETCDSPEGPDPDEPGDSVPPSCSGVPGDPAPASTADWEAQPEATQEPEEDPAAEAAPESSPCEAGPQMMEEHSRPCASAFGDEVDMEGDESLPKDDAGLITLLRDVVRSFPLLGDCMLEPARLEELESEAQ